MIEKPLILIANDDGYQAKGLRKLVELMRSIGRVVVVTTEQPMSAQSHSITTNIPLRYRLHQKSNDYMMYIGREIFFIMGRYTVKSIIFAIW